MLEGKKIVIKQGSGDFDPIPADKYPCQIVDVNAIEAPNKFKGGAIELKLNYQFVILDDKKELKPGVSLRGRYLWKRTSTSMHEKSWLFKLYRAILDRVPTDEEKLKFDAESIVGKRVDCMVEQAPSEDGSRIFSNIISFSKASKLGCMGQAMEDYDFQAAQAKSAERSSQGIAEAKVAPKKAVVETKEADVDDFLKDLEADQK